MLQTSLYINMKEERSHKVRSDIMTQTLVSTLHQYSLSSFDPFVRLKHAEAAARKISEGHVCSTVSYMSGL